MSIYMPSQSFGADFIFKVIVVGDGAVGKTSLILRYTQGSFNTNYIKTVGAQFSRYEYKSDDGIVTRLSLWDIAGQTEFNFMHSTFFNGANACIVVIDVTRDDPIASLQGWIDEIHKYCGLELPIAIFGNKSDLLEGQIYNNPDLEISMQENNISGFFLTSAKTGVNVTTAFDAIIKELISRVETGDGEFPLDP